MQHKLEIISETLFRECFDSLPVTGYSGTGKCTKSQVASKQPVRSRHKQHEAIVTTHASILLLLCVLPN